MHCHIKITELFSLSTIHTAFCADHVDFLKRSLISHGWYVRHCVASVVFFQWYLRLENQRREKAQSIGLMSPCQCQNQFSRCRSNHHLDEKVFWLRKEIYELGQMSSIHGYATLQRSTWDRYFWVFFILRCVKPVDFRPMKHGIRAKCTQKMQPEH